MTKTKQFSTWTTPTDIELKSSKTDDGDDNEDEQRRYRSTRDKAAYAKYFF